MSRLALPALLAALATLAAACDPGIPDPTDDTDVDTEVGDIVAPTVLDVDPPDGATNVPVDVDFVLSMSEEVDLASAQRAITLTGADGDVAITVLSSLEGLVIQPDVPLGEYADYLLVVSTELTDLAGNPLADSFAAAFRTEDRNAPRLVDHSPGNGAVEVEVGEPLVLVFDENIDVNSVTVDHLWVRPLKTVDGVTYGEQGDGLPLGGTLDGGRLELMPTRGGWQEYSTDYVVVVEGITDMAGNPSARAEFRFRTVFLDSDATYRLDNVAFPGVLDTFSGSYEAHLADPAGNTSGSFWYADKLDSEYSWLRNQFAGDDLYFEGGGSGGRSVMTGGGEYTGQHWKFTVAAQASGGGAGLSPEVYFLTNSHMGTDYKMGAVDYVGGTYRMGLYPQGTEHFRWRFIRAGER